MESTLTFQDIFKKSFLDAGGLFQGANLETLMRAGGSILLSVALGLGI